MLSNVLLDGVRRNVTSADDIVRTTPQRRQSAFQSRELFAQRTGRVALELVGKILRRVGRRCGNKQVDVIRQDFQALNGNTQRIRLFMQQYLQSLHNRAMQYLAPVLGAPDKVVIQRIDAASVLFIACRTHVLSIAYASMLVYYLVET